MGPLLGFHEESVQSQGTCFVSREGGSSDYGNPIFEGQHSPHCVLAMFSSVFAKPQPDVAQASPRHRVLFL